MVSGSGGSSKSKSKQESSQESQSTNKTKFPLDFLNEAYTYFGGDPKTTDYNPKFTGSDYFQPDYGAAPNYVGFDDFDKLEANQYGSQKSKLEDAYNTAVNNQREELSQSGLLNSPNQYLEGSARTGLDKGYLQQIQQAARDASSQSLAAKENEAARRTGFNQSEAARRTGFNQTEAARQSQASADYGARRTAFDQDSAKTLLTNFFNKLLLAMQAGRESQSTSSGQSSGSSNSDSLQGSGGFLKF